MNCHTPEEWIIKESNDGRKTKQIVVYDNRDDDFKGCALVLASVNMCLGEESESNARLFFAAKDLFNALNNLMPALVDDIGIPYDQELEDRIVAAKLAIAKATGKE